MGGAQLSDAIVNLPIHLIISTRHKLFLFRSLIHEEAAFSLGPAAELRLICGSL